MIEVERISYTLLQAMQDGNRMEFLLPEPELVTVGNNLVRRWNTLDSTKEAGKYAHTLSKLKENKLIVTMSHTTSVKDERDFCQIINKNATAAKISKLKPRRVE
jgi:hypothetical protein